jgi:hypothetical protein
MLILEILFFVRHMEMIMIGGVYQFLPVIKILNGVLDKKLQLVDLLILIMQDKVSIKI